MSKAVSITVVNYKKFFLIAGNNLNICNIKCSCKYNLHFTAGNRSLA